MKPVIMPLLNGVEPTNDVNNLAIEDFFGESELWNSKATQKE